MQFLSKKFWNMYDNIFKLPYQINLEEELLVNKLNNMLRQFELLTDLNDQINIAKLIFKLICQNLYFLKKYEKFRIITLQKIEGFEEYFYNKYYLDTIIEGIKLI
jgi:rRNA-processing protein FCF1